MKPLHNKFTGQEFFKVSFNNSFRVLVATFMAGIRKSIKDLISRFTGVRKDDSRLVGILGTLILHLIAAIIFMSFQIRSIKRENLEIFTVEFEETLVEESEDKLIELPVTSIEKILQDDPEMLNIARNLASRSEQTIDPADYIDMVKEELIKNGQLSEDNYIDEQKRLAEDPEENLAVEDEKTKVEEDKPKVSQEMAANYKGPTRIYYELEGRNHTYLPIPIYKCEGSGKVVLSIEVNLKGVVEVAKVIAGQSTTTDPCLIETAITTALISRFNPDVKAPKIQRGTLSYHFVAQ